MGGSERSTSTPTTKTTSPAKKGHKNFLESALGVTSLGAAMKALTGGGKDSERDVGSHRGRSMSRDSGGSTKSRGHSMSKVQKAAMAGLLAGASEALRIAKEPGSFRGEKAKRVVTAAVGAGALGGAHGDDDHSKRDIASSVIGGLLGNRVVHGSRRNIEEDSATGRSRSRSRFPVWIPRAPVPRVAAMAAVSQRLHPLASPPLARRRPLILGTTAGAGASRPTAIIAAAAVAWWTRLEGALLSLASGASLTTQTRMEGPAPRAATDGTRMKTTTTTGAHPVGMWTTGTTGATAMTTTATIGPTAHDEGDGTGPRTGPTLTWETPPTMRDELGR